jgi:uncharacterized membrane protein YuzA (DUF378 family)
VLGCKEESRHSLRFPDRIVGQREGIECSRFQTFGPRAADREPPGVRNLSQLRDELSDSLRRHSADDDEIDVEGIGDIADRVEWRIRSQVLDPPAMRTQCEAEGDQPQLVLLSRDAPEERARTDTSSPTPRDPEQPPADDVGCEVLLRDRDLATLPPGSEVAQVRHDDLGEEDVECDLCEESVEDRLRTSLVEPVECGRELVDCCHRRPTCSAGLRTFVGGLHGRSGSLGGSQPVRQVLLHDANALEIGQRIEAETSGRADWIEQAVSALPCTKQLGADSRAPAQLADPQLPWLRHALNIQNLDETLTRGLDRWYGAASEQHIYRRCTVMRKIDLVAAVLVLVGALNWGLVAIAEFDLVATVFGMEFGETNVASRIVYGLVGLAGVYGVVWLVTRRSVVAIRPARASSASH